MADFVKVAQLSQLPQGEMTIVDLEGEEVVVANVDGKVLAFGNSCTHKGGPLGEGTLEGDVVTCPWHGGEFSAKSGEVLGPPPAQPVSTYQVELDGDDIKIAKP